MQRFRYSNRRLLAFGLFTGAAIGSWTAWQARRLQARETKPGLIDWDRVRTIAISMNRQSALPLRERAMLDDQYRALVAHTVGHVSGYTGDDLPRDLDSVYAYDRIDWINANIDSFQTMFEPIERLEFGRRSSTPRPLAHLWHGINQTVLSAEIGLLLGYLARRVLGQYDLALLGREPMSGGRLFFVEPNIRNVERMLRVSPDQFRLWLALHETTHAFEFEAHPWLRDYMNALLEQYFRYLTDDIEYLKRGVEAIRMFWNRARNAAIGASSWIELMMSPEQQRLFGRMQALMAVVEGYSNHVMNAVGQDLMPDFQTIHGRFERRQRQRSPAEQIVARVTGLDLKLEQYRLGESFINAVVERRGHDFARRVWDNADTLPTLHELQRPSAWIARVDAGLPPAQEIG